MRIGRRHFTLTKSNVRAALPRRVVMSSFVPKDATKEVDNNGAFRRSESSFRKTIQVSDAEGMFSGKGAACGEKVGTRRILFLFLAAGRYVLYISYACPWANRCLATMYMKVGGLFGAR